MFTGLVEGIGQVVRVEGGSAGRRLTLRSALASELRDGESVAVSGVCLTAMAVAGDEVSFEVGPETLRATTIDAWSPGRRVNLERAMRADGRFGGHFVQGHVDGTATLRSTREDGDSHRLAVTVPAGAASYLVEKGSVALDGVSLTVAALRDGEFEVMIVPFTWAHTSLSSLAVGDRVNLEYDLIGKYVVRALELATVRPK